MTALQAIIFDVDGTLAETEEIHRAAFNRAFKEAGLSWHWNSALYGELLKVAGGKERLGHFISSVIEQIDRDKTELDGMIGPLHRRKTEIYTAMIESGDVALRPGVAELINAALADGLRLAIATTTSHANVDALLRSTMGEAGLSAFEVIAAGDSVPRKKPAPDIFLATLDGLQLPAEACVAIEDSANGLVSAKAAGLVTIVTPSLYCQDDDVRDAATIVPTLVELVDGQRQETVLQALRRVHHGAVISGSESSRREAFVR